MDERLMVRVSDQVPNIIMYCETCDTVHGFRYSHLKLDKGKRYNSYFGIGCFTEYLQPISKK